MITVGRVLCLFGHHDLTGWRSRRPVLAGEEEPYRWRKCKRGGCGHTETKSLRKRTRISAKRQLAEANEATTRG